MFLCLCSRRRLATFTILVRGLASSLFWRAGGPVRAFSLVYQPRSTITHQQQHPRRFSYYSSSSPLLRRKLSSSSSSSTYEEEDLARWETMYYEQEGKGQGADKEFDAGTSRSAACEIRVITLDLDNCLWNTTATIAAANDALADFLEERLPAAENSTPMVRVENVMGKLYAADKTRYAPIEKEEAKSPVLLTQLRKDAIRHVLMERRSNGVDDENDDDDAEITDLVEAAFAVWVEARHRTIPMHFAESVVSSLKEIGSLRRISSSSNADHDDDVNRVVVGAITDGNSDPMSIPEIAQFFDFCINAESVGISKPDKRVYLRGVARAMQHPSLRDLLPEATAGGGDDLSEQALEDLVGPWWIHIGDDFVKDCVAAKNLNMRTIWATELVRDKIVKQDTWKTAAASSKQKRTVEDLVKEVSEMDVVDMQVGADDYLENSLRAEFVDAVADEFQHIAKILRDWQEDAVASGTSALDSATVAEQTADTELPEYFEAIKPDKVTETTASVDPIEVKKDSTTAKDTKFCIQCGAKLPLVAKFCSSCGEQQ